MTNDSLSSTGSTPPSKKKFKLSKKQMAVITGVLALVLGYFGINLNVDGLVEADPQVFVLQTQVANLQSDVSGQLEVVTELSDLVDNHALLIYELYELPSPPVVEEPSATPIVTATAEPTSTAAPVIEFQLVKVVTDKAVSHFYKSVNKQGYPIMQPDEKSGRIKYTKGDLVKVLLGQIRADGSRYFYELFDHPGLYIEVDRVLVQ